MRMPRTQQAYQLFREERGREALLCFKAEEHDVKHGLLVDVGCGKGYLTAYFARQGIDSIGIDINKKNIQEWKRLNRKADYVLGDALRIPLKSNCGRTLVLNDVLEHIPYHQAYALMEELKRISSEPAKIYISVANRYEIREPHTQIPFLTWLPRCMWEKVCLFLKNHRFNCYPYTYKEMHQVFVKNGMTAKDVTWIYAANKVFHEWYVGDHTTRTIVALLKRLSLAALAYTLAKKVSVLLFIYELNVSERVASLRVR